MELPPVTRRRWAVLIVRSLLIIIGSVGGLWWQRHHAPPANTRRAVSSTVTSNDLHYATTTGTIGGQKFTLQIADTPAKQQLGLGQRDQLGARDGMVFVYNQPSTDLCYWMRDMHFSLDIMWLDSQRKLIYLVPDLSPATYPQAYCPSTPAQYVVEINAGLAKTLNVGLGSQIDLGRINR